MKKDIIVTVGLNFATAITTENSLSTAQARKAKLYHPDYKIWYIQAFNPYNRPVNFNEIVATCAMREIVKNGGRAIDLERPQRTKEKPVQKVDPNQLTMFGVFFTEKDGK